MAGTLNKVMLIGNLTREPELKKTAGGQSVCTFSVATNRSYTDASGVKKDQAEYHNIVTWARLAEICGQYLVKGKKVYIDGRLQTREWEGEDGKRKFRTEIVAENMIMLDKGTRQEAEPTPEEVQQTESGEIRLEDIPF